MTGDLLGFLAAVLFAASVGYLGYQLSSVPHSSDCCCQTQSQPG